MGYAAVDSESGRASGAAARSSDVGCREHRRSLAAAAPPGTAAGEPRGFPAAAADSCDEEHRRSPSDLGTTELRRSEADGQLSLSSSCGLSLLLVYASCRRRLERRPVLGKFCELLGILLCKLLVMSKLLCKSGPLVDSVAENEAEFSGVCAVVSVLGCAVVSVLGSVEVTRADKLVQPIVMSSLSFS